MGKRLLPRAFILVGISILCFSIPSAAELRCAFLDAGEGESIFLESLGQTALIDTGNVMTGKDVVRKLQQMGVKRLKYLIITHPHPDHMSGVFRILESFESERIYDNGQEIETNPSCVLYRWYAELVRTRSNYGVLKSGDYLKLGDSDLDVLWPEEGFKGSWNENSLVIMVRTRDKRILLTGDAPKKVEVRLVRKYGFGLGADILKVGHHGAADATGLVFLQTVKPEFAVISTNRDNINGYPSPQTIERLRSQTITIYRTYQDGDIVFSIDGGFQIP